MSYTWTSCCPRDPLHEIAMSIMGPWQAVPWRLAEGEGGRLFTQYIHVSESPTGRASDRAYAVAKGLKQLMRQIAGVRELGGALDLRAGQRLVFYRPIMLQKEGPTGICLYARCSAEATT